MFKIFPATLTHDRRKVPVKDFRWKEDCSDDPNIYNNWPVQYPQLKFYGVPTGSINKILVLDVDVKGDGFKTLEKYHVPLTMSQTTLSGGKHYIYKYPEDGKTYGNRVAFDSGLDIRGEGGYIISYALDNTPICDAPQWLLEQALAKEHVIDHSKAVTVSHEISQATLLEACENIREAPEGESNNVLNVEAYRVGQLVASSSLDRDQAYNELFKAAKDRGKQDYEAKATIDSGLQGGASKPIVSPFDNVAPELLVPIIESTAPSRWTPKFFTRHDLTNMSKLKKPQIFKDWSTEDISITTADGGTGKTTLKLYEAICLALGISFLGFECVAPGRTLYITGEDSAEKLGAMIGAILKQMDILKDDEKTKTVLNSIVVKKDSDLCLITKGKDFFIKPNMESFNKIIEAVDDIRPKLIIFDPISSFWGSESLLNDMSKAVSTFMAMLVEKSNASVEIINHMGKSSSKDKDMSQFAGRGGSALPSHARVSRVLRPVFDEEFTELTGMELDDNKSAMMCNVNKFSDGSPLYNKPFLIIREGFLFSRLALIEQKVKEEQNKMSDSERIFTFIKTERTKNNYPTKGFIIAKFMGMSDKISKDRIGRAIDVLQYEGHMGEKIKFIENPDPESRDRVFIITNSEGSEL